MTLILKVLSFPLLPLLVDVSRSGLNLLITCTRPGGGVKQIAHPYQCIMSLLPQRDFHPRPRASCRRNSPDVKSQRKRRGLNWSSIKPTISPLYDVSRWAGIQRLLWNISPRSSSRLSPHCSRHRKNKSFAYIRAHAHMHVVVHVCIWERECAYEWEHECAPGGSCVCVCVSACARQKESPEDWQL